MTDEIAGAPREPEPYAAISSLFARVEALFIGFDWQLSGTALRWQAQGDDADFAELLCGDGLGIGSTLETGTRIEVGTFQFPEEEIQGGERTSLSDSVTVNYFS